MGRSLRTVCVIVFLASLLHVEGALATGVQFHTPLLREPVSVPPVDLDDVLDDRPWENCTDLLENIAEVTSLFELCALMNAQPFTMCMNCASMYGKAIGMLYQLRTNTTDPGSRLCRDQFFSSAKVSIVDKTFTHIQDLWISASCDGCYQNPVEGHSTVTVRNETYMFTSKLAAMNKCINQSEAQSKNLTDLCVTCEQPYRDLNNFYNSLVQKSKDGNICFDMVDAMNATRFLWSSHLCSVHHYQNAPAFVVAGVVALLVTLFYGGAATIITPLNTELVQPKRLLRRRSCYGSGSPGSYSPGAVPS